MGIVARHGIVARNAPLVGAELRIVGGTEIDKEGAGSVAPDRRVAFTVAVIVVLRVDIGAGDAEHHAQQAAVGTLANVPLQSGSRGRAFANYRNVGFAVAVIVAGGNQIVAKAPSEDIYPPAGFRDKEGAGTGRRGAGTLDRQVEFTVAVIVARGGKVGGKPPPLPAERAGGTVKEV